jgi:hypothetical protein
MLVSLSYECKASANEKIRVETPQNFLKNEQLF